MTIEEARQTTPKHTLIKEKKIKGRIHFFYKRKIKRILEKLNQWDCMFSFEKGQEEKERREFLQSICYQNSQVEKEIEEGFELFKRGVYRIGCVECILQMIEKDEQIHNHRSRDGKIFFLQIHKV